MSQNIIEEFEKLTKRKKLKFAFDKLTQGN